TTDNGQRTTDNGQRTTDKPDMDVGLLILYGFGAFLALRLLAVLMQQHRAHYLQQLMAEHRLGQARRQREERQAATKAAATDDTPDDAAA
ncbi:MAG: hypothetical protein ACE5KM_17455, partial [Planctomycetaceae bacterium]